MREQIPSMFGDRIIFYDVVDPSFNDLCPNIQQLR